MFDVDYFIKKFEAIPDEDWTTGQFENDIGQRCALGHCTFIESASLKDILLDEVAEINDGTDGQYQQETPKSRILAALKDIKEK